jgi:hypothetical protein
VLSTMNVVAIAGVADMASPAIATSAERISQRMRPG